MTISESGDGSSKLLLRIKYAYWLALLIIAAMTTLSYASLSSMITNQRHVSETARMVTAQQTLIRNIGDLSNAPRIDDASQLARLNALIDRFENAQAAFLTQLAIAGVPSAGKLAEGLDKAGQGFMLGLRQGSGRRTDASARLEQVYQDLSERLVSLATKRADAIQTQHRNMFIASIAIIAVVITTIFRPLSSAISKNARDLLEARNSMAYVAAHDGLTGLHNRAFLLDHFQSMISGAIRRGEKLAVLQIDLDGFKKINDSLGHAAGDHVLVETADRMRQSCRASDLCVRLGGDEFVVILAAVGTTEDINMVAGRVLSYVNQPIEYEGVTVNAGASAGIAVFPVDANNADDLLIHADLALYDAKKRGGGRFAFFSDELRKELEHRKQLEEDLKFAIRTEAFDAYFQPQISLADGGVAGVEALMRWTHPERGPVPPNEFIPVAEKTGLMTMIGRIVIRKAIAQAAEWHRAGLEFGRLAVNVSGCELREPEFSDFIFDTLKTTGLPPTKLSLEIVESVILDDEKLGIAQRLRDIRSAGIHVELDDFGTGYASLSHVNPNEIDRLKIDRRFVKNIDDNSDNTKIVRAITELARGLGISIIAEGAETQEELNQLMEIGCEQVQGYSIAFPMPERETRDWLELRTRSDAVVNLKRKRSA